MQAALKTRLSIFMFLQYFIWGSWHVSMRTYLANVLKFSGQEIGAAYGAFAIGSMISPFFVGLIADRYFASQKMLTMLAGRVLALHTPTNVTGPIQHDWRAIWMTPALGACAVLIIFLIFFRDPPRKSPPSIVEGLKA